MKNFFVILGGMGTLATESFVHLLNLRTQAHNDQDYLNYIVANHATIPDRTAYITGVSDQDPRYPIIEDIQSLSPLEPDFFVVTCNTAHYFYDDFVAATDIPVLHMPRIAVQSLKEKFPLKDNNRIAFLGTEGSLVAQVYKRELEAQGYQYIAPDEVIQAKVNELIYHDVKERAYLNFHLYQEILADMKKKYDFSAAILGCTELSYVEANYPGPNNFNIIDAQSETVNYVINQYQK